MRKRDHTGCRFGQLVVLHRAPKQGNGRNAHWLCRCDCGGERVVCAGSLTQGDTTSCGCERLRRVRALLTTHGGRDTPEYRIWSHIKARCRNPRDKAFKHYGGRGIRVCDRWMHDFAAFRADMGLRPSPAHSIDRIDYDGPYAPDNCRWATLLEQRNNSRRTHWVTHNGLRQSAADWARAVGLRPTTTFYAALRAHGDSLDALLAARRR